MTTSKTTFWLVRHGQTDWNLAGRIQGQADIPLNETGRQQAEDLANRLAANSFDAIYSSDLLRAHQTATAVARGLNVPVQLDPRLREIHQGEWQGRLVSDLPSSSENGRHPPAHDPKTDRAPGGETLSEVTARAVAAADEICRNHPGGKVLVVSHGVCLAALICNAEGHALEEAYDLIPDNCTPREICWTVDL